MALDSFMEEVPWSVIILFCLFTQTRPWHLTSSRSFDLPPNHVISDVIGLFVVLTILAIFVWRARNKGIAASFQTLLSHNGIDGNVHLNGPIRAIVGLLNLSTWLVMAPTTLDTGPAAPEKKLGSHCSSKTCQQRKAKKRFFCKICLTEFPLQDKHKLKKCGCTFCVKCLEQYLEYSITSGNVLQISCPGISCKKNGKITQNEISQIISPDMLKKYTTLKKKKEVAVDKTKSFCPTPDCEGVCSGSPGVVQPSTCEECGYVFCFVCKESWHPGATCEEYRANISDSTSGIKFIDILKEEGQEAGDIKECPMCQVLIQRDVGCAQMMCGNCKHIFCWHCRKSLDSDLLLWHYGKGPCRNKLGHSRSSLFLYRTSVIAGMVFFGVMVLVASPLLLIVSPCLVLSKCCFH